MPTPEAPVAKEKEKTPPTENKPEQQEQRDYGNNNPQHQRNDRKRTRRKRPGRQGEGYNGDGNDQQYDQRQRDHSSRNQSHRSNQQKQPQTHDQFEVGELDGVISNQGVLEVISEGYGFLRSPEYNYLPLLMTSMYLLLRLSFLA